MLIVAGHVSREYEPSDDQYLEPELRLFFRDVWPKMSEDEQGVMRGFVEVLGQRIQGGILVTPECPIATPSETFF